MARQFVIRFNENEINRQVEVIEMAFSEQYFEKHAIPMEQNQFITNKVGTENYIAHQIKDDVYVELVEKD